MPKLCYLNHHYTHDVVLSKPDGRPATHPAEATNEVTPT